jgi:hypothetical protein
MNELERFKACADAYGADARRWPTADRALHARYATVPAGAAILATAARTDDFLDAWTPGAPTPDLAARIAADVLDARPRQRRRIAWSAAAFAASAVLGFAVGFMQAPRDTTADAVTQLIVGPAGPQGFGL